MGAKAMRTFLILIFATSTALAQSANQYMFCYATEPVAGTDLVFVSNIYQTNSDTEEAADDYHVHAKSDGYDVPFKCIAASSFGVISAQIIPVMADFFNRDLKTIRVDHP